MKSLLIAWKDFKIRIKDRKGFLTMILMPIILTAILGSALSTVMEGDGGFSETTLGIYQEDHDLAAETFRTDVLSNLDFLKVKTYKSEAKMQQMLDEGKIDVGISFPKQWSSQLNEGKLKEVKVLNLSDTQLKASVIESILQSYSDRIITLSQTASTVIADLTQSTAISTDGGANMKKIADSITSELMAAGKSEISIKEQAVGKKLVSSMQYYAAGMAVMFLLFNATTGAKSFIQERSTETLARLMISPTNNTSILIGKFLGTLLFAIIQFFIFLTATSLFFHVDWGTNIIQLLTVGISYSIAVSGISMLLAAIVSDAKTTDVISGIGIQIFAILGGSMVPIYLFPNSLQLFANITPNKWALTSFLDIMSGTSWNELTMPITVLSLMGLVSLVIGTWGLKVR